MLVPPRASVVVVVSPVPALCVVTLLVTGRSAGRIDLFAGAVLVWVSPSRLPVEAPRKRDWPPMARDCVVVRPLMAVVVATTGAVSSALVSTFQTRLSASRYCVVVLPSRAR